jgi:tetratricopeptide (TPR) repeat protein
VERHGHTAGLVWNDGEQVEVADLLGDLDRVLESAERYFSHPEAEQLYQARGIWALRARSFLARGHVEQAVADAERALARLRETGQDAQVTGQVLSAASRCLRAATRVEEADSLLGEALSQLGKIVEHGTWDLPLHLVELDRADEYLGPSEKLAGHLWLAAGRASASGDLIGGSEIYGRIGARFPEAWAGLLAGERGDTSRLDAALAYFEEQRATSYVQRCRALLQASA